MTEDPDAAARRAAAAVLASDDDRRLRHRRATIGILVVGTTVIVGSLFLWPRGLFGLAQSVGGDSEIVLSLAVLVAGGIALLALGVVATTFALRRLAGLRSGLSSRGKAHEAFTNEPDLQMPAIGMGHSSPLDQSIAQFANPSKLLRGRK